MSIRPIASFRHADGTRTDIVPDPDASNPMQWDAFATTLIQGSSNGIDLDEDDAASPIIRECGNSHERGLVEFVERMCIYGATKAQREAGYDFDGDRDILAVTRFRTDGCETWAVIRRSAIEEIDGPLPSRRDRARKRAVEIMEQDIKTYRSWANGDNYGAIVYDADGVEMDSCWDYVGYDGYDEVAAAINDSPIVEDEAA